MASAANNNSEMVSTTEDNDSLRAPLTPDENSRGTSTPEPPAVREVPLRRSCRGRGRSDKADERVQSVQAGSVEYKSGDYVYFEEAESDFYTIGLIEEIKMSRREKCSVIIKCFWRTGDVPEMSKQALLDREGTEKGDPRILARELFITEQQTNVASHLLRGKCSVVQCQELRSTLKTFDPSVEDSFFYVYAYIPETKRLVSTRAEIKVGSD